MRNNKNRGGAVGSSIFFTIVFLAIVFLVSSAFGSGNSSASKTLSYSEFQQQLSDKKIKSFTIQPANGIYSISGQYNEPQTVDSSSSLLQIFGASSASTQKVSRFTTIALQNDSSVKSITDLANTAGTTVTPKEESNSGFWISFLGNILPLILLVGVFYVMMSGGRNGQNNGPGGVMNFGRSRVKPADPSTNKVRFEDVAGAEEEKQELVEVVDFLKNPGKYRQLGARIPKGVLLEGPPGTGKTLLARAVAGEANVPFYSISGSDFVEMFVGVGASRVRDLFENAKKTAPAIIFIDEIDAVGRRRGTGMGGGNDEREQTLNQILIEMDGFGGTSGVIVLASTNRSDVLDPALLRSGRFDRKILVGAPDVKGREAILNVHAKGKPFAKDVSLKEIARQTPGFVGADLENLLNESALLAARRNKKQIDAIDLDEAEDRVIAGPAKKDRMQTEKERQIVANHEAGHAIIGLVLDDAQVVRKVTIVPRGRMGGYALMLPKDENFLLLEKNAKDELAGLMGGRAAEMLVYKEPSSGASNDFQQATQLARRMVTEFGMSSKIGMVQLEGNASVVSGQQGSNAYYSESTSKVVDEEIKRLTQEAFDQATAIIKTHKKQHQVIADALLEYETLDENQIKALFETGKMPVDTDVDEEAIKPQTFAEAQAALDKQDKESISRSTKRTTSTKKTTGSAPKRTSRTTKKDDK